MVNVPRVVIAAPGSGHGKTSVATGLLAALRARGLTVSPHKVGPDYIDPGYHGLAAGRPGRNLDPWLVGEDRIISVFTHGAVTPVPADIAVVEGVMGLFDGAAGRGDFASTAHVAGLLRAPVILVVDASGMSASAAALLHGFATFDPKVRLSGVIFNKAGSQRHEELLREAAGAADVPVLGVLRRDPRLSVPSRHLGLVPAEESGGPATEVVDGLAAAVTAGVDLEAVVRVASSAGPLPANFSPERIVAPLPRPRLAIAGGRAFTFGYAEHPELLSSAGAEVVTFDPLRDPALPESVDGLIIGGGFPEEHAASLSANSRLRSEVAALARAGAPIIAECAGLLYLARSLDGHPMCGVLDASAVMTDRLTLGYREAVAATASPLAEAGTRVRGHEFHRTTVRPGSGGGPGPGAGPGLAAGPGSAAGPVDGVSPADGAAWHWTGGGTAAKGFVTEGFVQGGVHASYLHTHWAGVPGAAERITAAARAFRASRAGSIDAAD